MVVLPDAHVPAAVRSGPSIGEPEAPRHLGLRGEHRPGAVGILSPEPLVIELAVDEDAVECPPGAAPVLVDKGPDVGVRTEGVDAVAHDHRPATFVGPRLGPPDAVTVDDDLTEPGSAGHQ